jgi:hypothetical protein
MISDRQLYNGCGACRRAGVEDNISIAASLTQSQAEELRASGKHYYCVEFNRPVFSDEGKACSSWVSDKRL